MPRALLWSTHRKQSLCQIWKSWVKKYERAVCHVPVSSISIISSSFMDMQGLHNWIKNWTLSAVQFCTFPMWSKSGSSTVPALDYWCAANFGLKYRKRFESCLFLSGHLKVIAISPCQFRLVIRFFLISLSHRCFGAASWSILLTVGRLRRKELFSIVICTQTPYCQRHLRGNRPL